jgi:hypothetical protein
MIVLHLPIIVIRPPMLISLEQVFIKKKIQHRYEIII